jgi:hypothetical protein
MRRFIRDASMLQTRAATQLFYDKDTIGFGGACSAPRFSRSISERPLSGVTNNAACFTCRRSLGGREELGIFKQAAEFLLAGADVDSQLGIVCGSGFVFHDKAFQPDDAEIVRANFPDLGLAKFDGSCHAKIVKHESVSPDCHIRRDCNIERYFFLLDAADLATTACFFFKSALLTLDCFCVDFF